MLNITLKTMFDSVFSRDSLLALARQTGACQRLRLIHPADFVLSLVSCALGDETRSVATARRLFYEISDFMPEESSFFDRFTDETVVLLRELFQRAMAAATVEQRITMAELFCGTDILDILAIDACQVGLPAGAKDAFPATMDDRGGLKLTCTLSVLFQRIRDIVVTDARQHDSKVMRLPRDLKGQLLLLDQGYAKVRRFWTIDRQGGSFITPLRQDWIGPIVAIRCGMGQRNVGKPLDDERPYRGDVDVDVSFRLTKARSVTLRVVVVTGYSRQPDGSVNMVDLWLLTNLSPEKFSPADVATLYRLRREIETDQPCCLHKSNIFRVGDSQVPRPGSRHGSERRESLQFLLVSLDQPRTTGVISASIKQALA